MDCKSPYGLKFFFFLSHLCPNGVKTYLSVCQRFSHCGQDGNLILPCLIVAVVGLGYPLVIAKTSEAYKHVENKQGEFSIH